MLTQRQGRILQIIVGEYISTANPVGSLFLTSKCGLGVSSATVRNDMARLEEEGYILRRHVSGGGIPSDKGYRYFVESLAKDEDIPVDEQLMLSHMFHQVERELEEWTHLAAALLARMVHNVAVVTFPKAAESRIKYVELVALQESLAILILLLQEAKLRQHLIAFDEAVSQGELDAISRELNALFYGLTWQQVVAQRAKLSPRGEQVKDALVQVMASEDEQMYEQPYIEGLRHILTQPEFEQRQNLLRIMEVLESGHIASSLLPEVLVDEGVKVVIGGENREEAMRGCSVVITRYGIPGEIGGALGVIGPTRMPYERSISAVRYMGSLMSNLVSELCGGPRRQ